MDLLLRLCGDSKKSGLWKGHKNHSIAIVVITTVTSLVYLNSLKVPFNLDDVYTIINNPSVHLEDLSFAEIKGALNNNRPVSTLSFALNYYFGGLNVSGYHVVNLLIHCITASLVYIFFLKILSSSSSLFALLGTLLWAVHPVHTQAVTYIVQRMTGLATMFFMLSLVLYIQGSESRGPKQILLFLSAMGAGLLGFGSKEIVVTLPFVILLYEYYFNSHFDPSLLKRKLIFWLPFLGITFVFIVASFNLQGGLTLGLQNIQNIVTRNFAEESFTSTERILTESRVLIYYLSLLILPLPSRLNLDYDFPISTSLLNPLTTLYSVIGISGLLIFALWGARKYSTISFGIFWFFINLALESTFIKLDIIFEHRLYLPSIGVFLALSWVLMKIAQFSSSKTIEMLEGPTGHRSRKLSDARGPRSGEYTSRNPFYIKMASLSPWAIVQTGLLLVTLGALGFYSTATILRNVTWQDSIGLWEDTVRKSPGKARVHNNLGILYRRQGKLDLAHQEFDYAFRLRPDVLLYRNNLASVYVREGKPEHAIQLFQEALQNDPTSAMVYQMLGKLYSQIGRHDLAIIALEKAITLDPAWAMTYSVLGRVYQKSGYFEKASMAYEQALQLIKNEKFKARVFHLLSQAPDTPDKPSIHYQLGQMYEKLDKLNLAIQQYREAIEVYPVFLPARMRLSVLYSKTGRPDLAETEYKNILEVDPTFEIAQELPEG